MINLSEALIIKEGKNIDSTISLAAIAAKREVKPAVIMRPRKGGDAIPIGHVTPEGDWIAADAHSMRSYVEEYMGDKYGDLYDTLTRQTEAGIKHRMQDVRRWAGYQIMAAMVSASRSILARKEHANRKAS